MKVIILEIGSESHCQPIKKEQPVACNHHFISSPVCKATNSRLEPFPITVAIIDNVAHAKQYDASGIFRLTGKAGA